MSRQVCNIWKSRAIVDALKERPADDIWVMDCPHCGVTSYYNQGSHFSCRACGRTYYCLNDGEESGGRPFVFCNDARTLDDAVEQYDGDGDHY